jgi:hypothetical protein
LTGRRPSSENEKLYMVLVAVVTAYGMVLLPKGCSRGEVYVTCVWWEDCGLCYTQIHNQVFSLNSVHKCVVSSEVNQAVLSQPGLHCQMGMYRANRK